MKIALEVKNNSKIIKPSKNNVLLYDGKQWYITTKEDIFAEYEARIDKKLRQLDNLIRALEKDNADFKEDVSKDILAISNVVKELYKGE